MTALEMTALEMTALEMTALEMTEGVMKFEFLRIARFIVIGVACTIPAVSDVVAQGIVAQGIASGAPDFITEDPASLAAAARQDGDATRGAIVFYQQYLSCAKCHIAGDDQSLLGPDLSKAGKEATDTYLIESILDPSKAIKQGYQPVTITDNNGKTITGLLASEGRNELVLRDPAQSGKLITILKRDIDERIAGKVSVMPAGQVNALASRQQFLDLLLYLFEIRDGGPPRAAQLEPPPSLYAMKPLPDYESHIDHAGMLADAGSESIQRGQAIYQRVCANCHGTHDRPGSLPTSLNFASGKFKSGNDPYTMYQTITRGFGLMVPQTWMVPQQKYDVIHYVREAYLKQHNPDQYFAVDQAYLDRLPKGDTRGPAPSQTNPWEQMDYGPNQVLTLEIGNNAKNFAYKGNAVRLDHGQGGVSQGRYWMIYDYDTMRVAAAWSGEGFIDWHSIHFDGEHNIHPRLVGRLHLQNPTGPGWANPDNGSFEDTRLVGRDDRIYGPLPRKWAQYQGMYYYDFETIVAYTVGNTDVLEMPGLEVTETAPVFKRTFNIGPRKREMILQVAQRPESKGLLAKAKRAGVVVLGAAAVEAATGKLLVAGVAGDAGQFKWTTTPAGDLRLTIPPGTDALRFTLFVADVARPADVDELLSEVVLRRADRDLAPLTKGGTPRWPGTLTTKATIGNTDGPFAVDVLTHPASNPWNCRMRLTGFDFFPDGDRMAVSSWDGSVYLVTGLNGLAGAKTSSENVELTWQRIASGLFQPLGVKIVDGRIYVTCRDAIYILNDLNGDGEADFLESFNSDHQVTDHFHEFAMGLQTDDDGNFYYAKSAASRADGRCPAPRYAAARQQRRLKNRYRGQWFPRRQRCLRQLRWHVHRD